MADDYASTASAMMQGAGVLHQAGHYRNTCYLAGYVVECAFKALLRSGNYSGSLRMHDLEMLQSLQPSTPSLPRLASTMVGQLKSPKMKGGQVDRYYCHWDPDHRYDGSRWDDKVMADTYLREAEEAFQVLVDRLQLNQGGP